MASGQPHPQKKGECWVLAIYSIKSIYTNMEVSVRTSLCWDLFSWWCFYGFGFHDIYHHCSPPFGSICCLILFFQPIVAFRKTSLWACFFSVKCFDDSGDSGGSSKPFGHLAHGTMQRACFFFSGPWDPETPNSSPKVSTKKWTYWDALMMLFRGWGFPYISFIT